MKRILLVFSMDVVAKNQLAPDTLANCEGGLAAWQADNYDRLALVGGVFRSPEIQTIAIAKLMEWWFEDHLISCDKMIIEIQSLNTWGNIERLLAKFSRLGLMIDDIEITVVAQALHALRIWWTFRFGYGIKVRVKPGWFFAGVKRSLTDLIGLVCHIWDPRGEGRIAKKQAATRVFDPPAK